MKKKTAAVILAVLISLMISSTGFALQTEKVLKGIDDAELTNNDIFRDLTDFKSIETAEQYQKLYEYGSYLRELLKKERILFNIINSIYYTGSSSEALDTSALKEVINWKSTPIKDYSILFGGSFFGEYYHERLKAEVKVAEEDFFSDSAYHSEALTYFKEYVKKSSLKNNGYEQLIMALQDKLLEKLINSETDDGDKYFIDVLSLRDIGNTKKAEMYIYQLYESRIRIFMLESLLKEKLKNLKDIAAKTFIGVYGKSSGTVYIKDISNNDISSTYIYEKNFRRTGDKYKCSLPLVYLINAEHYELYFKAAGKDAVKVTGDALISCITINSKGYLELSIDKALNNEAILKSSETESYEEEEYRLELAAKKLTEYKQKAKNIIAEMNNFSIYREMKLKTGESEYVKEFEKNKAKWLGSFKSLLYDFTAAGKEDTSKISGFIAFNKTYVDICRRAETEDSEARKLLSCYRQEILQYRQIEEANLWILDMFYHILLQ
ncbi:MAG: hypothetical protein ACOZCL_10810 [Bacillota bacterium]